jgi:pimeloyl-ACP methyl ester carboxylesterase
MQINNINWQGASIQYKVTGQGKTVVLLHGFGEDSTVWQPQIDFLEQHFHLIIPDIPGTGKSQYVPNANIETYAEILKEIISIELQKVSPTGGDLEGAVSLIGHSMGGYITLAFAEKYPQYLNSFGLFHSSAFADTEEKKETRKKAIGFIRNNGGYAFLKNSIPGLFTKEYYAANPAKVEALIEDAKNFTDEALIQYYEAMIARPDRTAVLKNFEHPILFLIGEHDPAVPLQSSLQQCHLPSQSHVHILSKSAHMGMLEETEKANKLLLQFLLQV